ncbi:zinc finger, CCHC-type containing protein [Tanacetum coccineum]|uniref:Zinc finger, CCHC-type containing protein n=1 Tax=Tanacetum coccineum TaxID=301880 RepID=A0ABQ4WEB3_9ASTR
MPPASSLACVLLLHYKKLPTTPAFLTNLPIVFSLLKTHIHTQLQGDRVNANDEDGVWRYNQATNGTYSYPHSFEELHLSTVVIQTLSYDFKLHAPKPYRHLMAQARLGSGIRLCFVLAMLERLNFRLGCTPQVLVIVIIHSLVLAVGKHCKDLKVQSVDPFTREVDAHIVIDDTNYMIQQDSHKSNIDAIIGSMAPKQCQDFVIKQPDNVYHVLLFYTASLTDNLRSFVTELLPPYANELLMLPPLEYNNKDLDSLPQVIMKKIRFLMKAAFAHQQVVIYVDRTTDITLLKQCLERKFDEFHIVVAQPQSLKMKKSESDSLLSFRLQKTRVLVTFVPISPPGCFDNSKNKMDDAELGIAHVAIIDRQLPFEYTIVSRSTDVMVWNAVYDAHNKVTCLMLGSITPELHRQFKNVSPYEMLQEFKSMFEKQARVEWFDLIQTFHACKQEEGKPVGQYVIKMKNYVAQLEHLGYVLP